MLALTLSGSIGYDEENDPNDVAQTGAALATLGHFDALEAVRSGRFDDGLDNAIRAYQSDNDLDPDGILLPNGPTQNSLNDALRDHRPGPSLLPVEQGVAPDGARARDLSAISADDGIPRASLTISDKAAHNLARAQESTGLFDVLGRAFEELAEDTAGERELEQLMKSRGYRYVPDPMGRVNEGEWVNERGDRVGADEARSITSRAERQMPQRAHNARALYASDNDPQGVTIVAARASAPARRIASNFESLAYDLDTATAYVKHGEGNIRVAVPAEISATTPRPAVAISRINAGIREAVVANALLNRPTSAEEIASVARDVVENRARGQEIGYSRVKDMLTEAALNAATPEQRLHARGLLAVYQMEEREAEAAGHSDPRLGADAAIAMFAAGLSGDVSWSVYDPEENYEGEDEVDEAGVEGAADDPENPRRPRGSQNENTREAAREGRQRHRELRERVRIKGRGWNTEGYVDEKTGKRIRPDVTTRRGYLLEYKPDTPTGRAAGERQCAEYTRITQRRCRVVYYTPSWDRPASPSPPQDSGRGSGGIRSGGTGGAGVGSGRIGNPKLPGRNPWELLR